MIFFSGSIYVQFGDFRSTNREEKKIEVFQRVLECVAVFHPNFMIIFNIIQQLYYRTNPKKLTTIYITNTQIQDVRILDIICMKSYVSFFKWQHQLHNHYDFVSNYIVYIYVDEWILGPCLLSLLLSTVWSSKDFVYTKQMNNTKKKHIGCFFDILYFFFNKCIFFFLRDSGPRLLHLPGPGVTM